ncbi:9984_t:CDS:1, partial [Funneliformis caledonium]
MPKKTERKNTNRGRSASPISDKLPKKKQNTQQTADNDLSLTYVKEPLVT